ncbi:Lrp/AsnC family transcriptional regulator [Sandaracinobacteroides saxicola]|uniref:Lrp/AsnC family transcriptional regulator n=1 Tax=Sandaracinobacteroides saxicola TaxID=2759707 RepID=A0A7G5IGT3_9SPHN|nr:Lrp/AsnC family transcriptional regulator [Sandaracinobacteroides saxicola]QMW22575.1 Lrp/AsnC family transcriptional regulator [Sandaracinobacteroides saxicola]
MKQLSTELDLIDTRILREVQRDATLSLAELAAKVGLSATPCWKRIKRMEAAGIITKRVTLVNREAVGLGVTAFVSIRAGAHDEGWLERFAGGVSAIPEVVEFYRMAGEVDYLLKVVCHDIADYDRIYKKLIKVAPMGDVSSAFAMEQIKFTTEMPLL